MDVALFFYAKKDTKHFPSVGYKTIPLGKNKKDYEMEGF